MESSAFPLRGRSDVSPDHLIGDGHPARVSFFLSLHSQVGFSHLIIVQEIRAFTFQGDLTIFQDVSPIA